MGLCKCPKKKVTNQFCFEHRVNVCEHCMITNHPKCVVQSYLHWLQDSDYSSICELCQHDLSLDECSRLICYHVYHWPCLNHFMSQLPANTAPAGYTCPSCRTPIFPPSNLVSPVADKLMLKLSQVNWARAGIGLPLLEDAMSVSSRSAPDGSNEDTFNAVERNILISEDPSTSALDASRSPSKKPLLASWVGQNSHQSIKTPSTSTFPGPNVSYAPSLLSGVFSPKRLYDARDENDDSGLGNMSYDHDDNKYRRRSAMEWFGRWFKSITSQSRGHRGQNSKIKRYVIIAVLLVIAVLTLIVIMTKYGRATAEIDPFLDPMANPNIRVLDNIARSE